MGFLFLQSLGLQHRLLLQIIQHYATNITAKTYSFAFQYLYTVKS